jgi:hypothetical protein
MFIPLWLACTPEEPKDAPDTGVPDTGTPDTDTPDTGTPDTGTPDTGTPEPPGSCWVTQDVTSGGLYSAWRSPSGALYAVGASSSARVRAPDGTWSLDPVETDLADAEQVHGADDGAVWALTRFLALERQPDGTWLDRSAPFEVNEPEGLHVFAQDDVLVLRVEDAGCDDCPTQDTPVLLWWDGSSWTEQREPTVDGPVFGMAVLPDRTVVLATGDQGLWTTGAGRAQIPTPAGLSVRSVAAAPDGTLVALADDQIAMGTVEDGLVSTDPGVAVDEWTHAWASSASDVWALGTWWEQGLPHSVIVRWDGAQWTTGVEDQSGGLLALAGGDGEVFAVGAYDHELVLVGDEGGLAVEREVWGPDYLQDIVVDDVTGEAWSYGYSPVLGVFEDGLWSGVPLPDSELQVDGLAVSDERVVLYSYQALHLYEDGALATMETEGTSWRALAGADGVLFAAGESFVGDGPTPPGFTVMRHAGTGWELMDTSSLPEVAQAASLWADGPDDLWLGLRLDDRGGLAHWDGASWTLVLDNLSDAPYALARQVDGQLYFTQFTEAGEGTDSLWVYDGQSAYALLDMPPDVRDAHLLADGTLFVSVIARAATGDEDLYGRLLQREPGGDWVEVFTEDYSIALAGTDDTVWAEQAELSWTYAPCGQ